MTPANERFGRRAHEQAWSKVYMDFLPDSVVMIDLSRTERDRQHDEDHAARVHLDGIDAPVELSFQEKYRRARWADKRELTLAYYNAESEEHLYLEKSDADFFLYGYYDSDADELLETIIVDMVRLKYHIADGSLPFTTQAHGSKGHHFMCIPFDALEDENLIAHHYNSFYEPNAIETYEKGETIRQFRDSDYWVTRDGHVWSEKQGGKWMKEKDHEGYKRLGIRLKGQKKCKRMHRLVAECFHGPPPTKNHQVHHKNERRYDNRASNLEWVTREENVQASLSSECPVEEIRVRYCKEDVSQRELAEEYKLSRGYIGRIVRGERSPHLPGPIKGEDY